MKSKQFCIVGLGNSLRSDDGVGGYVCKKLEAGDFSNVTIIEMHQLDISMAEELSKYTIVVFADAAESGKEFYLERLNEGMQPQSFTHHINAALLVSLAYKIFAANTVFYIGAVKGINFDFGNAISQSTIMNADVLVEKICVLLNPKL